MTSVTFGETGPDLDPFTSWYRERPTQLAFAVSLLLHALLIALIPGFRSVSLETPSVLTVQIVENEITAERSPEPDAVMPEQVQPSPPVTPPEFVPPVPQPRVVEQAPVTPRQIFEPQPAPLLPQPEQAAVESVDRPQLAPSVPRQRTQVAPEILARPKLVPDEPVAPVVRQEAAAQLVSPPEQIADVRRQPRVVRPAPVEAQRPDVTPPTQPVQIQQPPVAQIEAPPQQVTEVRREPRAVNPVPARPQPRPDAPPPAVSPVRIQQPASAEVAPAQPAPVEPIPVERTKPQVAAAPVPPASVATRPSVPVPGAAPVVAAPAPPAPAPAPSTPVVEAVEPSLLEAYRHSVSQEVMRHMRYPPVAVRRKWEGKTVVEMQVSADGEVTQLSVAESSGKDVLDEAAVAMVRRSLPLPKPPPGVRSVRVPVVFRLQG